jgi:hypothetical protein
LYMDEIFGFFPPVANPPSKTPLLTLLKQARAFGLGVLLATQNPVDLDYKGLSNAGTWFIGRLQTERDKARVVEGLLSGSASAGGGRPVDQAGLDRLLSSLEKRQFLLHDVHDPEGPRLLRTRFTLSYLRGPLTREQLKGFKQGRPKELTPAAVPVAKTAATQASAIPVLANEITQVFLGDGPYVPCLLGVADVTISDTKAGIDVARTVAFLIPFREGALPVDWESAQFYNGDVASLPSRASDDARAEALPDVALKAKSYAAWTKEFSAWLFANQGVSRFKSPSSGLLSEPNESESAFRARIELAAREARDRALDTLRAKYDPKFAQLKEKIRTESQALEEASAAEKAQGQANTFAIGASLVGAIFGRTSVTKIARGVSQAARAKGQSEKASERTERRQENKPSRKSSMPQAKRSTA